MSDTPDGNPEREVVVMASRLGTFDKGGEPIYWANMGAHWTRHRSYAQRMPESVATHLANYLRWEGVIVELVPPEHTDKK